MVDKPVKNGVLILMFLILLLILVTIGTIFGFIWIFWPILIFFGIITFIIRDIIIQSGKSILSKLSNHDELSKYAVELIIFAIIGGIFTFLIIGLIPEPELKLSCEKPEQLKFIISVENPSGKMVENFKMLIFDNAIYNHTLALNRVFYTSPSYYGVTFKDWAENYCNARDIKLPDVNPQSKKGCEDYVCITDPNEQRGYAVEISCEFIPPNSILEIDANLLDRSKYNTRQLIPTNDIGWLYLSHWSQDTPFEPKSPLRCADSPTILIYKDFNKKYGDESTFLLIFGKYKMYVREIIKYFIIFIVIIMPFIIRTFLDKKVTKRNLQKRDEKQR